MSTEQRQAYPFRIIEADLPSSAEWHSALVVISASANNSYHLKVASDNEWPNFIINHGFTNDEFNSWVAANNFFPGDPLLEDVMYWTSCIPYELRLLLKARDELSQDTGLAHVLQHYKVQRDKQLQAQQLTFIREFLDGPGRKLLRHQAKLAVVWMELGLSTFTHSFVLNQQLMYIEDKKIQATTPLAKTVLTNYWTKFNSKLDMVTQKVFEAPLSEWTADAKGRVLEKYLIRRLETAR